MTAAELDVLLALCDAEQRAVDARERGDSAQRMRAHRDACEALQTALDRQTVRTLVEAYKCLAELVDANNDSDMTNRAFERGEIFPATVISAQRIASDRFDAALEHARQIVEG